MRASFAPRWLRMGAAGLVGFAGLLAVASVLLLAAKLQYPFIGAGSTAGGVVKSIVVVALACLRVPVSVGGVEVAALPLGAMGVIGALVASSARVAAVATVEARSFRAHVAAGAMSAVPFAVACWVSALVFKFEGGSNPVSADPMAALLLGLVWGGIFGALGGARAYAPIGVLAVGVADRLRAYSPAVHQGIAAGAAAAAAALVAGTALVLLWIIVVLARDPEVPVTIGTAAAAAIYLVAFAPNVAVAVLGLAVGGTVDIGAKLTVKARALEAMAHFSLGDWNGGPTPRGLLFLVIGPLAVSVGCGFYLRARRREGATVVSVLIAAAVCASILAFLAWVGDARLGAGLVRPAGFARVAPRALGVFVLSLLWLSAGGVVGWELRRRFVEARRHRKEATDAG